MIPKPNQYKGDFIGNKTEESKTQSDESTIEPPITEKHKIVQPEKEEQSQPKYIGYNPINIFEQTEPYNFPYVIMPKPGCIIKFPRKGRTGLLSITTIQKEFP